MPTRAPIVRAFALLSAIIAFPIFTAFPQGATSQGVPSGARAVQPLTDADMRERGAKLAANQHKNDQALDQYERIEHELDTTGGAHPRTLVDKRTRLVPNGAGTTKVLLEENGRAVSSDDYRRELQTWVSVLQFMTNPNDDRMKSASAKYAKKQQDRARSIDAMQNAFTPKWLNRETIDGHDCDVIQLQPDPNFHPHSMLEGVMPHVVAKIWVDHDAVQLVRVEAQVTSDVWVGGGVLGKLYKGGKFTMEQAEVLPGIWLPERYQFDFSGREFLFSLEKHESIEASHYRYIGTAKDALQAAQAELASGKPTAGDP
jgi:hypothetical protein